jgi:hypothetical protein
MEEIAGTCEYCGAELRVVEIVERVLKRVKCECRGCKRKFFIYFDEHWDHIKDFPEELIVRDEDLKRLIESRVDILKEILTPSQIEAIKSKLEGRRPSPSNLSRARRRLRVIEELTRVHFEFLLY